MDGREDNKRRAAARALRRKGESIRAIADQVGAAKSSVSEWCRDIELTAAQAQNLSERALTANRKPRNTQWKRREEIAAIRRDAAEKASVLSSSPLWAAGVALYWAKGAKSERRLSMANADPQLLRLLMRWTQTFHGLATFSCAVHLHAVNDEIAARRFWSEQLDIPAENFTKTFIKPDGSGHRKNRLECGVARVSPRKSTDAWIRTMVWIEELPLHL